MLKLSSKKITKTTIERKIYQFTEPKLANFKVVETTINGQIIEQEFSSKKVTTTHPFAYKSGLTFHYYENTDFLENKALTIDHKFSELPEPTIIPDITQLTLKDITKVLAVHLAMDGNIYELTSPYPLPIWKRCGYIGGFTNSQFKLQPLANYLKTIKWIANVEIVDIPYYNASETETKAIEFSYRCPKNIIQGICKQNEHFSKDIFGIQGLYMRNSPLKVKSFLKPKKPNED